MARFEGWYSAGREFDAVIAGQAWHWVEPLSGATKAEVLRPGGAAPTPDAGAAFFARPTEGIRSAGAFSDPEQWRFEWERRYTRAEWFDQLPTAGGHGRLPAPQLNALLAGTGAAIDALGGSFTMHYDTVVITATLAAH